MEHYLEQLNLTEMMEELDGFFPDASLDLWGMFERILSGEWKEAGQMAWQGLFGSIWEQVAGMKGLFVSLLILGRKVPERYQMAVNFAGFMVLMGFMLLVTFHDVFRLIQ